MKEADGAYVEGVNLRLPGSISGRLTGLTTTGSWDIVLQGQRTGGDQVILKDIHLYARAVRTS